MELTRKDTKQTIGGWNAPCEAIDYGKLAKNARQQVELLRNRLHELNSSRLQRSETELARRRTVRILTDMYYEQKSYWALFAQRAERQGRLREEKAFSAQPKTGEARQPAPPAEITVYSENKENRETVSPASPPPPAGSAARAARLCGSRTSRTL